MHELVPIVLFTGLFAMIFGIAYIRSRENIAMLEKGINPRSGERGIVLQPFVSLKIGLLLTGAGLGLLTAYLLDTQLFRSDGTDPLYPSLIGIGGGIGLIVSYFVEKKIWDTRKDK